MKCSVKELVGCAVHARDGDLGRVADFYFDDHRWTIRYMVVDTAAGRAGQKVLISTAALETSSLRARKFPVNLTRQQILDSPSVDTAKPVSRQQEELLHTYYGWQPYWALDSYSGVDHAETVGVPADAVTPPGDSHLRSTQQVIGYHLQAADGAAGNVEDFILDDEAWGVCYLVMSTHHWLPGKTVLIPSQSVKEVSWGGHDVVVALPRLSIQNAPAFDPAEPLTPDYESLVAGYYQQQKNRATPSEKAPGQQSI